MSFFNSMMGKVFTSAAVSAGATYVRDTLYEGSFLQKTFSDIGTATGLDKIFGSDPVGQGAFKVGTGVAQTVVDRMLGQGIGADPRSGRGFPGGPNIPTKDTYGSDRLTGARKYNGFYQGSNNIIENAVKVPEIVNMAMEYTQKRVPFSVTAPNMKVSGKLGALRKGGIKTPN